MSESFDNFVRCFKMSLNFSAQVHHGTRVHEKALTLCALF